MPETATIQRVYDELRGLKRDVAYIKDHMIDPDMIMTPEEEREFEGALEEIKAGKTTPLSEVEKELGL